MAPTARRRKKKTGEEGEKRDQRGREREFGGEEGEERGGRSAEERKEDRRQGKSHKYPQFSYVQLIMKR